MRPLFTPKRDKEKTPVNVEHQHKFRKIYLLPV